MSDEMNSKPEANNLENAKAHAKEAMDSTKAHLKEAVDSSKEHLKHAADDLLALADALAAGGLDYQLAALRGQGSITDNLPLAVDVRLKIR